MSEIVKQIEYKGFTINVLPDFCPSNPWEEWDCQPPLLVLHDRRFTEYGIDARAPQLTREQIKAAMPDLKKAFGFDRLLPFCRDYAASQRYNYTGGVDLVNDALSEYVDQQSKSEQLELLAVLHRAAGSPALCTSVHGFSQGDYAEVLLVATPEWIKATGIKPEHIEQSLKKDAELYEAWAFGSVYGYDVEGIEESGCWGFYGYDHEESGLLEHAQSDIDCHIERVRRERIVQVKTWIRHHVPLHHRVFA